jgi:alginate O-acetyltransferase complex protein AlgI
MILDNLYMWLILPFAVFLFYQMPNKYRWILLLIGSLLYLGYYSIPFLAYATVFSIANYAFGIILYPIQNEKKRRRIYQLFLILNIGQLIVYKYVNFLFENINWILNNLSVNELPYVNLLVPIGISYFTFQGIGYVINIYRKQENPEKHLGYFLIFNLFFPKILSGPIERSEIFLPQLRNQVKFSIDNFNSGLRLFVFGLFKKLVIAERLAIIVNSVYGDVQSYHGITLLIIMLIQAFYIYTDFSGYTDMALGIARFFNINLTDNFNRPFLSKNVSEFWRRWHISLSAWCNDYIFKTIIFKRRAWGKWAAIYGVFVTFFVIGIWHGPMWSYVILGILQGIAINYEFFTKRKRIEIGNKFSLFWNNLFSRLITYVFFSISLIFFFSRTTKDSFYFVSHILDFQTHNPIPGIEIGDIFIITIFSLIMLVSEMLKERGVDLGNRLERKPLWIKYIFYYIVILIVFLYGEFAPTNFIYFQF